MGATMQHRGVRPGLLSAQDSLALARPLRVWSAPQKAAVWDALRDLLNQWHAEWRVHGDAALSLIDGDAAGAGVDMLDAQTAPSALHALLWGEPAVAPEARGPAYPEQDMAARLCEQAWQALHAALQHLAGPDLDGGPAAACQAWSGAIVLAFAWGGPCWALRLSASAVEQVLASRGVPASGTVPPAHAIPVARLVPLAKALGRHVLPVRIDLEPVSLSLGQLQSLALGDVITLPHALERPAMLRLRALPGADASQPLCAGWLGQAGGRVGIEHAARPKSARAHCSPTWPRSA